MSFGAAQAGTLTNGVWTPNCNPPGDVPAISSKSPTAFNESQKTLKVWQDAAQQYADCVKTDTKADQEAVVSGGNGAIGKLNDQINAMKQAQDDAIAALKKKGAKAN
jgi:hypothetical protein